MNAPRFPGLISSPAAVCPSMLAPLANTRFLKLCDALATCQQRCEGPGICPGLRKAVGSALRPKVACTGAGTPLHCGISVPSMSESGHFAALPQCSIAVCFTPVSGIDSRSQGLPSRAIALNRYAIASGRAASIIPRERSWVAGEAPCLEDRGVHQPPSKTGVAYDNRGYHPAASAYDRGHELAQAWCAHPARSRLQLQAICCLSQAITRDRRHARTSACSSCTWPRPA